MEEIDQKADHYFRKQVDIDLQALLAPIPGEVAVGAPAAQDESYRRIRHEREDEDPTLPLGPWERELKRANWANTSRLAAQALATRSKDLQLAAWLFEALIARSGFDALAPNLHLIEQLFRRYGPQLHPQDSEHRINLLQWINQKLLPALRKVPITAAGGAHDYAWNDWEQAQRNEQLRASLGKQAQLEGPTLAETAAALACTSIEQIAAAQAALSEGLSSLDTLEGLLASLIPDEAPGFGALRGLLERIEGVLIAEARRRGVVVSAPEDDANAAPRVSPEAPQPIEGTADRKQVYAALASIARTLEQLEPHSPVPYLIRRAVSWGGLNTAQLYNEVFVRCGGHINIFELLGLEEQVAAQAEQ